MTIRIAFTGSGYISKIHAQAAQNLPDVELEAVVNHRPASMSAFADAFGVPRQYARIEDLLRDGGVDAISINTPNYLHAPQTVAALEAGVHVMVEKPMAMDAAEAERMIAAGERSGALLMVAHCWRFDEEVLWVREQMEQGCIGRAIRTKGYGVHVNWGPAGWFTKRAQAGGGALADVGIHAIDTVRFLLGDPKAVSVYAQVGTYYGTFDVDDTGIMLVNWDNGVTSYIESGWWQPHADGPEAATQVYGTEGLAHLFPTGLTLRKGAAGTVETISAGFPMEREPHCPQSMYDAQMAYFVDCIRRGCTPVPGGAEGLTNMQIVDAAYESGRSGQVVEIGR